MIPGLGLIKRPDMATLLETNNRFIEAYLVGLNHEMARELLWREYPTDQRGTYFNSFWTGEPELIADLHEAPWRTGGLAAHMDKKLDKTDRLPGPRRPDPALSRASSPTPCARRGRRGRKFDPDKCRSWRRRGRTRRRRRSSTSICRRTSCWSASTWRSGGSSTPASRWWFTLSENPTEPRFGLDERRDKPGAGRSEPGRPDLGRLRRRQRRLPQRRPAADLRRDLDSRRRGQVGHVECRRGVPAVPAPGPRRLPGDQHADRLEAALMADLNEVRAAVAEGNAARDALAAELRNSGSELAAARRERDRLEGRRSRPEPRCRRPATGCRRCMRPSSACPINWGWPTPASRPAGAAAGQRDRPRG